MKILNIAKIFIISAFVCINAEEQYYNILAMDGGGIRGIIPAVILKHMEKEAYDYATSKGYTFPKYKGRDNVIAMKDLFDMTAGTSTGSILAAGLVYPNVNSTDTNEPGFFA